MPAARRLGADGSVGLEPGIARVTGRLGTAWSDQPFGLLLQGVARGWTRGNPNPR
jgi:hypothetical protein